MRTAFLGRIAVEAGRKAGADRARVYSVTKHNGFVPSDEYFNKQVFSRDLSGYKFVDEGTFAYATIHLDEGSIGIAPEAALISPMYTAFKIDDKLVEPRYLIRLLKSPRALQRYAILGEGSANRRRSIPFKRLATLEVPLPDLSVQCRIADILDKADALRTKRRETIKRLDALSQSIFHEMFGSGTSSSRIKLAEVLKVGLRNGLSPSTSGTVTGEVLTLGAVTGSELDLTQKKSGFFDSDFSVEQLVRTNQILICRGNGNKTMVGKGKVVREFSEVVGYPDTIIAGEIDTSIVEPAFLQSVWEGAEVRAQIERGARTTNGTFKVNQALLGTISFQLPALKLQKEFARRVAKIDQLKASHRAQLEEFDDLLLSFQDRAFKGEL